MGNLREYLDIGIGANLSGRVVFELFADAGDSVIENFRSLCLGRVTGMVKGKREKLSYRGCRFFRVVEGDHIECGDFEHNNGEGGSSVFGGYFKESPNTRRHSHAGILSMKRMGPSGFGSQFIITLSRAPHLDNQHIVIGHVVEGMEFIRAIGHVPVDSRNAPKVEVGILECGALLYTPRQKDHMSKQRNLVSSLMESLEEKDEDSDDNAVEIRCLYTGKIIKKHAPKADSATSIGRQYLTDALSGKSVHMIPVYDDKSEYQYYKEDDSTDDGQGSSVAEPEAESSSSIDSEESDESGDDATSDNEGDPILQKLQLLSSKLGECSNLNQEEAAIERELGGDANKLNEHYKSVLGLREDNSDVNYNRNPSLNKAAMAVEMQHKQSLKKEKAKSFGWNVFNQDALYRANKKRLKEMSFNKAEYELQKAQLGDAFYQPNITSFQPTEAAKQAVTRNLEKQNKQREKFSRRRTFDDEAKDISYINQRNRVFNQKLDRAFKSHAAEIKQNLERGTAL
ncbi:putative peptidyl-prolyl cis-trans isomerase [Babesia divergens]|uniref:Peptidyl-prolyl cis-trans isomerase n=1 Tax=Babesia divergens TaxID=32595 RepID=A0AAD9GJG9_BABDI|nr:putative peptidyl-prolyl cis-trans isomerase [Babesia divergens]